MKDFGTDVVVNAGGGIHGHPMGTAAGGRAFQQAIAATLRGQALREAASEAGHEELQAAINAWGIKE
ncbi:2,3-diketo-5-methylthiopentyl-1-phosphate enolase [compost metagenome]